MRKRVDVERERLDALEELLDKLETDSFPIIEELDRNRDKITETSRNAAIAHQQSSAAFTQADENLSTLRAIHMRLETTAFDQPISEEELTQLKIALESQEALYNSFKIEQQIEDGKRREIEPKKLRSEIDQLIAELANLEKIRDIFPTHCLNKVNLEQEGQ